MTIPLERSVKAVFLFSLAFLPLGCATNSSLDWHDMGAVPLAYEKYAPQGMTWVNDRLLFANTWKNHKSRVYELDPNSMEVLRWFDMPPEAVHTGGLTWGEQHLWAVDYESNKAYKIDLEASFRSSRAAVVGEFDTTLKGTSACCFVPWKKKSRLAISDFGLARTTILVNHQRAIEDGTARNAIVFSYKNQGFSQGLTYALGHLWEAENCLCGSVVNMICLDKLERYRDSKQATVLQFTGPSYGIEDLAWDGQHLWTSDEWVFRVFRANLRAALSEKGVPVGREN